MRHVEARLPLAHPSLTKQLATARAVLDRTRSSEMLGESNPPFQNVERETEALRKADQNVELRPVAASLAQPPRDGASDDPRGGRSGAALVPRPSLYRAGKANVVARTEGRAEGPSAPSGTGETVQRDAVGNPRSETPPEASIFVPSILGTAVQVREGAPSENPTNQTRVRHEHTRGPAQHGRDEDGGLPGLNPPRSPRGWLCSLERAWPPRWCLGVTSGRTPSGAPLTPLRPPPDRPRPALAPSSPSPGGPAAGLAARARPGARPTAALRAAPTDPAAPASSRRRRG